MSTLNPIDLARFMVLDGAAELVEAFGRLPEGPVRHSLIGHAQALATAYMEAPPGMQPVDPLQLFVSRIPAAVEATQALPEPQVRLSSTPEGAAVELRMQRMDPRSIAIRLKLPVDQVRAILKRAKADGARYPSLHTQAAEDVEAEAEEAAKGVRFTTTLAELTASGGSARARATKAAKARGISLVAYMQRKARFLVLRRQNWTADEIATELFEAPVNIRNWIAQARDAGIELPSSTEIMKTRKAA